MAITTADFKVRFPEFDSIVNARVQLFLDDAQGELDEDAWDTAYERGVFYLAAHLLAQGEATASGVNPAGVLPLSSAAVDGESIGFARAALSGQTSQYWQATQYGIEFMRMKRTIFIGMHIA